MTSLKAAGTSFLKKLDVAVDLLDRDLGVDPRRVHEVLPRLGERGRHRLLARDERRQPIVGGA